MRSVRIAMPGAGLAFAVLSAAAAHADNSPLGVWIDHTGRGAVEITDCGGKLCGRVAWVDDAKNADQCGKKIIGNVAPVGKNKWDNGWIYDPDRDKNFDVELTALDGDKLRVKGYAGSKWLSETYTWKRAPADLKTCAAGESAKASPPAAVAKPADTAKADTKPDTGMSVTDDKSAPVQLNATAPEADASKAPTTDKPSTALAPDAAPKADQPSETAKADQSDDNEGPPGKKGSAGGGGKVIARLMEELESGDGPVKLKRSGKTCKVTAPYVGVISFPCDGDRDND
jgi:uncharacterized protein (DUF2147 family)